MTRFLRPLHAAMVDDKGVTALEYGMIAAATIVVGLAVFGTIGTDLNTIFTNIQKALAQNG